MYPILARYGPFLFYSYTLIMGLGLLAALGLTAWRARQQAAQQSWLDGVLLALFVALVGGRAAFVAANWGYFQTHVREAWLLWHGGLSYHAGLVAGIVTLWLWSRRRRISFTWLGALLAPGAALWSAAGWLACYLEGCAYGRETVLGIMAGDLPDSYGVFAVRYQTQLIGLFLTLLVFFLVWWLRKRVHSVPLLWLTLSLLSAVHLLVSLFRGDEMPKLVGWRIDTMLNAVLVAVSLLALLVSRIQDSMMSTRPDSNQPPISSN